MTKQPTPTSDQHAIERLIEVMRALRDPDNGCPWDLEQDFKSIAPYTIEEAYEVADAIERGDMADLREELGDLLLQPIYHAQMAAEAGVFDIHDVIKDITDKMIFRHPHVFGDANAISAEDVNAIWDERKAQEKLERSEGQASALDGVTKALPALLRAEKLQNKAAKVGFEWESPEGVLDKLEEEIAEMREALAAGTLEQKADELGDLMFLLANMARMLSLKPETILRQCNDKFERRFRGIESDCRTQNIDIKSTSLTQLERMWTDQKKKGL